MKKPDIILIFTDQQRYDTIAALGNKNIFTPNLDRLVRSGVSFVNATTPCPVCMPARWSLFSGKWVTNHKCESNHHRGELPSFNLPGLMRQNGYITAMFGKNHSFLTSEDWDIFDENPIREEEGNILDKWSQKDL